jgi:ParB family chromosome partitioning protein
MERKQIVYIPIEKIHPNPENPRKNLGDLTEITESIRKKGIMQNLTVVPDPQHEGEYITIIGHRRCAAAKEAGLKEVPCIIDNDIDFKDQFSTMMVENMQRNDLTIKEQADGFQMMLELGDNEEQIAEKTGFSRTTIRHRLNIAKLDSEIVQKKENDDVFQLSLKDLYELEKVESINKRNELLDTATDSKDLVWRIKRAVSEETKEKNLEVFKELFKKNGIKKAEKGVENERYSSKWDSVKEWDLEKDPPKAIAPKVLKGLDKKKACWVVWYGTIAIIVPKEKVKRELTEREIRDKENSKKKKTIKAKQKEMYEEIAKCILMIVSGEISSVKEDVEYYKELVGTIVKLGMVCYESDICQLKTGLSLYEISREEHKEECAEYRKWFENLTDTQLALISLTAVKGIEIHSYRGEYQESNARRVQVVVDFLRKYGYSPTEEQEMILDGTHEMFVTD